MGVLVFVLFLKKNKKQLVFFNAIKMLYVYSLNKNITVCNEVSNESLFISEILPGMFGPVVSDLMNSRWQNSPSLSVSGTLGFSVFAQHTGQYLLLNNSLINILC